MKYVKNAGKSDVSQRHKFFFCKQLYREHLIASSGPNFKPFQ